MQIMLLEACGIIHGAGAIPWRGSEFLQSEAIGDSLRNDVIPELGRKISPKSNHTVTVFLDDSGNS